MQLALKMARRSGIDIPVGAIIVENQVVIARACNTRERKNNPLGHAEMSVIAQASRKLGRWRLNNCTLYVTLEPCVMCAGAILQARLERVVFGALDPKAGAVVSLYKLLADRRMNHRPQVTAGICQQECSEILKSFFKELRKTKKMMSKQN